MTAVLDRLLSNYEGGQITRRELLTALSALTIPVSAEEPLAVRTLNHVTIFVSNVQQSVDFYQKLFGMSVLSRQNAGVNLATGSGFVGIYPAPSGARPSINHFCLGVAGFDAGASLKTLGEHGVNGRIRMRGDVQELYLNDPDNISVQLQDVGYSG